MTWSTISAKESYNQMSSFTFIDENFGWAVKNYQSGTKIITSGDGGASWKSSYELKGYGSDMKFSDLKIGYCAFTSNNYPTAAKVIKTTNSGLDWVEMIKIDSSQSSALKILNDDIWFITTKSISGLQSIYKMTIYYSSNSGTSWNEICNFISSTYMSSVAIDFSNKVNGILAFGRGELYWTSDGGYTWAKLNSSVTSQALNSIDFIDNNNGFASGGNEYGASGNGIIMNTKNGGNEWNICYKDSLVAFYDIKMLDQQTCIAVGNTLFPYPNQGVIIRTSDAGKNWSQIKYDSTKFKSVFFKNSRLGWATCEKLFFGSPYTFYETILHTSDGGLSWKPQTNTSISGVTSMKSIYFIDTLVGYAVSQHGIVLKTINGGIGWTTAWGNLDPNLFWNKTKLNSLWFKDKNNGWIAGSIRLGTSNEVGMIMHTTNGGNTWDTNTIKTPILKILFNDFATAYIVTQYNGTFYSIDECKTWNLIKNLTPIYSIDFLNSSTGWAVGDYGSIYRLSRIMNSINEQNNIILRNYILKQNYPNPFNPSTTIEYTLSKPSKVEIIIYNILGQEVELLVNEFQTEGTHKINWIPVNSGQKKSTSSASGIYFYRMNIDGYYVTKKMIFLQ